MVANPYGVEAVIPRRLHLLHELLEAFDRRFFSGIRSRERKSDFHVSFPLLASRCRKITYHNRRARTTEVGAYCERVIAPSRHSTAKSRCQLRLMPMSFS